MSEREEAVAFDHLDWLCDAAYNHGGCHELGYNPVKFMRETIATMRAALTTAERERDEARRERDSFEQMADQWRTHADSLVLEIVTLRHRAERAERQLSEVRLLCDEWPNYIALNVLNILDAAEGTP